MTWSVEVWCARGKVSIAWTALDMRFGARRGGAGRRVMEACAEKWARDEYVATGTARSETPPYNVRGVECGGLRRTWRFGEARY